PGFDQVRFGDLDAVRAAVTGATAAILIEPVQGEGGIRPATNEFLRGLRAICDEHGLLLILDEVQSGVGRTGKFFAHEWSGVTPDIMAIAKGIGGGFPLGACLATAEAASGMKAGTHGSTYGGNPLAMAVGNAVLDVVLSEGFLEHVRDVALVFRQGLASLKDRFPDIIEDIRGEGLLLGMKAAIPQAELLQAIRAEHLLGVPAGDNVIRLLPPLTVTAEEAREGIARIERAAEKLRAARTKKSA
ncbi:MAG: acetylornithine transaminase, partial [Rhizobiaceae bacterium]|nr:acetylornithine transaminase [Rhizobiaceae bacterium]